MTGDSDTQKKKSEKLKGKKKYYYKTSAIYF